MHPLRYRTKMCKDGPDCHRPFCFFAHTAAELRRPQEASTLLGSLSPQALSATAQRLMSNAGGSPTASGSSSMMMMTPTSSPRPAQLIYQAPSQVPRHAQLVDPAASGSSSSSGGVSYSYPPLYPGGVRAGLMSSGSGRVMSSPSSGFSSSGSNIENLLLMRGSSLAGSGDLSGHLPAMSLQHGPEMMMMMTQHGRIMTAQPAAAAASSSGSGAPLYFMGSALAPQSAQQQQQVLAQDIGLMMQQMHLPETAGAAGTPVQVLAAPPLPPAAAMALVDVQPQSLTGTPVTATDLTTMLQQQQQLAGPLGTAPVEILEAPFLGAGLSAAAAACAPLPVTAAASQCLGGAGGSYVAGGQRFESLLEAPLFSGVQW